MRLSAKRPLAMRLNTGLLLLAAACAPSAASAAGITGPKKSALEKLEEGSAIRDRVQYRGGRFNLAPVLGATINDPYQRNVLFGAQLTYFITDSLGLGLTALGGLGMNTDLADQVESKRKDRAEGGFSNVAVLGSLDLSYAPITGKLALFGRQVVNYDMHVVAGVGGAKVGGADKIDSFAPAPVAGVGLRTFVAKWFDVNLEVRDYIYSAAVNAVTSNETTSGGAETKANSEWSNHFGVTVGFGFSFPNEPEISH